MASVRVALPRSTPPQVRWLTSPYLTLDRYRGRMTQPHHQTGDVLPPLPSPTASPDERANAVMDRLVVRLGGMPDLDDYRRAYASCGAPWPGDDVIRQRHRVAPAA